MSYRRFSSSAWYVFWSGQSGDTYPEQLLEIHSTYSPLGFEYVVNPERAKLWLTSWPANMPGSEAEQEDLRDAIRTWLDELLDDEDLWPTRPRKDDFIDEEDERLARLKAPIEDIPTPDEWFGRVKV